MLWPLYPGTEPHISNENEAGWVLQSLSRYGRLGVGKNLMPLPGFETLIVQSVL